MRPALLFFSLFLTSFAFSQNSTDSIEQYCLVRIYGRLLSSKVEVSVDSGQSQKVRLIEPNVIRDKQTGKKILFDSEASALNYFAAGGWKLMNAFPVVEDRDRHTRYLFKKIIPVE